QRPGHGPQARASRVGYAKSYARTKTILRIGFGRRVRSNDAASLERSSELQSLRRADQRKFHRADRRFCFVAVRARGYEMDAAAFDDAGKKRFAARSGGIAGQAKRGLAIHS